MHLKYINNPVPTTTPNRETVMEISAAQIQETLEFNGTERSTMDKWYIQQLHEKRNAYWEEYLNNANAEAFFKWQAMGEAISLFLDRWEVLK